MDGFSQVVKSSLLKASIKVLCALSLFGALASFQLIGVNGNSMAPTLVDGSWTWGVRRCFVLWCSEVERDQVITFYQTRHGRSQMFIKRVVGIPGDTVATLSNGALAVNGTPVARREGVQCLDQTLQLHDGEYAVIGDNHATEYGWNDSWSNMCKGVSGVVRATQVAAILPRH